MLNGPKIKKLQELQVSLERIRDAAMKENGGHLISDDLYDRITELDELILYEFGHDLNSL